MKYQENEAHTPIEKVKYRTEYLNNQSYMCRPSFVTLNLCKKQRRTSHIHYSLSIIFKTISI